MKKATFTFSHFLSFSLIALLTTAISAGELKASTQEIMVYTSRNEHLVRDIFRQYQEETGVRVRYRTGDPGQLIQTIMAEGENTRADIFMTVDAGNLWFAKERDILREVDSEILQNNIPSHLRDSDNHWFGLSIRARTIVYNSNNVEAQELSTYEALADEKWRRRLCLRTSGKVYNQSLVAMLIHELGLEKAREVVAGWMKNTVEIFSNDTSVLRAVAAGQCDIGIVNTYYYGRLINDNPSLPLKIFWPNQQEDQYGAHVNISGAGILKHSKNVEAAQAFLEWLSSKEAQNKFAQVNLEYAINNNVEQAPLVQSWGDFKHNTSFNLSLAGELQGQAVRLMHEVGYN